MANRPAYEKALEISQSALEGTTPILEAALALCLLTSQDPSLATEDDCRLFVGVASETDHLPIGLVKKEWHPDVLPEKEREIARCENLWWNQIRSACVRVRRSAILIKLVISGHITVTERQILGTANRADVIRIVRERLANQGIFPEQAREGMPFEGVFISITAAGAQITWQRTHPTQPISIAERRVTDFRDLDDAVEKFVNAAWGDDIDGVKIVDPRP